MRVKRLHDGAFGWAFQFVGEFLTHGKRMPAGLWIVQFNGDATRQFATTDMLKREFLVLPRRPNGD